jgi:hypothetical protein
MDGRYHRGIAGAGLLGEGGQLALDTTVYTDAHGD